MKTAVKLGPADHGRKISLVDFNAADAQEGYRYELIDGKVYVSPEANLPENFVEEWIGKKLLLYVDRNPAVVNYFSRKARVFVLDREDVTNPEPDIALYKDFPLDIDIEEMRWEEVTPVLVVEVLSKDDPKKDLVRNVELYFEVPSIKEYWVLDNRAGSSRLAMRVHRRYGKRWRIIDLAAKETYSSNLLPGFELVLDPRT